MMLTVIIQAGGESRRMGKNKALLSFLGKPLISRVVERLRPIADDLLLTSNQPETLAFLGLPVHRDVYPGGGALSGLLTALKVSTTPLTAVVACDMPFISPALLQFQQQILAGDEFDVVMPKTHQGHEPFHAVYRTEVCVQAVEQAFLSGEKRLISWLPAVRVCLLNEEDLAPFGSAERIFLNVNTPEEFERAEQLAQIEMD